MLIYEAFRIDFEVKNDESRILEVRYVVKFDPPLLIILSSIDVFLQALVEENDEETNSIETSKIEIMF